VVNFEKMGVRTATIDCDVIQADGGTRCASIGGAFVALALAFSNLKKVGVIAESPLVDYLAAVSVGIVDGEPCLDLCYTEDSAADVDMNVVMTGKGELVEVQGTAEHRSFSRKEMDRLLDLAWKGISEIVDLQKRLVQI
jgi:ribonuclease PH